MNAVDAALRGGAGGALSGAMAAPAFVSDVGKVLIDFDFSVAARRLAERAAHPAETVLTCLDEIKLPYEDGRMDDATFVREAVRLTGFQGTAAEFEAIWCEIFTQNEPMHATLGTLAGRVPMYLLSNTSGLHKDFFMRSFEIFRPFEDGVYSYSAGCSKPGEAIFEHTIARFGLDPARTFYVDDLLPNIETAARLGFRVFHYAFDRHAAFESELASWRAEQGIG